MKTNFNRRKNGKSVFYSLLLFLFLASVITVKISAHGGKDHGDKKPKTIATDVGTVAHTSRLGAYEVMVKHPQIEPDAATAARLFVTKFETNEPAADAVALAIEFEAANGAVTAATVEKTDRAGSFSVKIPALPAGVYAVRAKLTYGGETDTATFSGVEVGEPKSATAVNGTNGEMSWARTWLIGFVFTLVLAMFGVLVFFVWRFAASDEATIAAVNKETVSA